MSRWVVKYRNILCFVLLELLLLFSGALAWGAADEVIPLRLVAVLDRDDQGESIEFPTALYYDYWASETYLVSSTGRITVYDQNYFPVASFGKGRGMLNPGGIAVDRRGYIYVCQGIDINVAKPPRLIVYNQAFFPVKEIIFTGIPELVDFVPERVAVSESGEIYLTGLLAGEGLGGVAVLSQEGEFVRILAPPENNVWKPGKKKVPPASNRDENTSATRPEPESENSADIVIALPAGLKPKASASARDEDEDKGQMVPATITDVKIDRQGRIYLLSRAASLIYVLDAKGKYLFKFGEKGGVAGKLSNPISLAIDLERRVIYVCDYMRHSILCYDYDGGKFVFEFGGRGLSPLWFNFPNSVEVDQRGRVLVSDLFNRRVQVIDPSISERHPRVATLGGVAAGGRPEPEEVRSAPVQPEIEAPLRAELPVPVTEVAVPLVLAPSFLPAPTLPAAIAAEAMSPLRVPLVAVRKPPVMSSSSAPRELAPVRLKKMSPPSHPPLKIVAVAPVRTPAPIPRPAAVRVIPERGAGATEVAGESSGGIMARFRSMPAAVAVYGPVAALLGVGSWLLYTNR